MLEPDKDGKSNGINGNRTVRFGAFEADLHSGEVRKSGSRIKLQEQPFKVLQLLLEHPGALVTRDELQARIWPSENFGDFDHAVNVAIGKLRTALGDTADNPCFIETVPRRGYRFVAKLEDAPDEAAPPEVRASSAPPSPTAAGKRRALPALLAFVVAAILVGLGVLLGRRTARPQSPDFQRLTVRHVTVYNARFAPDGHNVIYAASWHGAPIEIFSTDLNLSTSRDIELPATICLRFRPPAKWRFWNRLISLLCLPSRARWVRSF